MYFKAVKDRDFQFSKGSGEFEKTTDLEPDLILYYRKPDIIMSSQSVIHYKIILEILLLTRICKTKCVDLGECPKNF